jgi:hypothetical protein
MTFEQRIQELKDFERECGVPLPMFPWRIVELEDRGYVVDLCSGEILSAVTVAPTASAQAVLHLLAHEQGSIAI